MKGANVIYENVAVDENIITSRGMGTAFDFGLAIVSYFMDDEVVADVKNTYDLLIEFVKTYQHIFIVNNHTSIKTSSNAVLE